MEKAEELRLSLWAVLGGGLDGALTELRLNLLLLLAIMEGERGKGLSSSRGSL